MIDLSNWSTADRINAGLLLAAVLGIGFTWWQARAAAKTQRASFLRDLYATLNSDPAISEAFYRIEYGRFEYGPDFHESEEERVVDRLLSFVDLICELHLQGVLKKREMQFFEYRFRRIYDDNNIQEYLMFLRQFYSATGTRTEPFPSFTSYTKRISRSDQILAVFGAVRTRVKALLLRPAKDSHD